MKEWKTLKGCVTLVLIVEITLLAVGIGLAIYARFAP